MLTEILKATDGAIARAAALLASGQLVAFPTETVYGLGARADDAAAVQSIYRAKGRPADKPLIVHVTGIDQARRQVAAWPEAAEGLARDHWPGPLTLVLPRSALVPDAVTAGGDTVAVRAPNNAVALALLRACSGPIAAPSANISGEPPPTTAQQVLRGLAGRIPLVLDGGATSVKTPSTIVDVAASRILREGVISAEQVARWLPGVARSTPTASD